jgi:hypothetical protein
MDEATSDIKSVGNSLQANVQNVISDIDRSLGNKLNLTFDKLDAQERRLAEDAERLVALTREATDELTKKNFERAHSLVIDADMLAYNASYSLPCRTLKPRVLEVLPTTISSDSEAPLIKVRGNFLMQGKNLVVKIGKTQAAVTQRTDNEIMFEVPKSVLNTATTQQQSISATIEGLASFERRLRLGVFCRERSVALPVAPSVSFLIDPPVIYAVKGRMRTSHMVDKEVPDLEGRFDRTGSDHCDDSFAVDQNLCLVPGEGTFTRVDISNQTTGGSSNIGPVTPSGDRCVFIGGQVRGKGARREPIFHTWLECYGRGWVGYNYKLWKRVRLRDTAQIIDVEKVGIPDETSFSFVFPSATSEPGYEYDITVEKRRGDRVLERRSLSSANPVAQTWNSRVVEGMLAIEVQ